MKPINYILTLGLLAIMFFAWRQFYITIKNKKKHGR